MTQLKIAAKKFWCERAREQLVQASYQPLHVRNMIQRSLLRQSRVAGRRLQAQSRTPLSRFHFPPIRISQQPLGRIPQRWQSTTTTAAETSNDANTEASTSEAAPKAETQEEDPLKKELDAKNREVIDLKVRPQLPNLQTSSIND